MLNIKQFEEAWKVACTPIAPLKLLTPRVLLFKKSKVNLIKKWNINLPRRHLRIRTGNEPFSYFHCDIIKDDIKIKWIWDFQEKTICPTPILWLEFYVPCTTSSINIPSTLKPVYLFTVVHFMSFWLHKWKPCCRIWGSQNPHIVNGIQVFRLKPT